MDCNNTAIESLDLSKNMQLESLYCYGTNLGSLNLSNNTNLNELICSSTGIHSLDLTHNTQLQTLYCEDMKLSTLDLSKNIKLRELSCSYSWLSTLDLIANIELRNLNCSGTDIVSLDLSKNTKLERLFIRDTAIESIDLKANTLLEMLNCSNTKINCLDLSKNEWLESLACDKTQISSLDLTNNKRLVGFSANGSSIAYLDLSNNPLLGRLEGGEVCMHGDITITTTESTLDLARQFPGIDVSKIVNIDGDEDKVVLNGSVLSGYHEGSRVTYTYDCSAVSRRVPYLTVILYFRGTSNSGDSSGGVGGFLPAPTTPAVQEPTISTGEGYTTELSEGGKTVDITVKDGYEIEEVFVNGISKGKVTSLSDLKTGDKVEVKVVKKKVTPTIEDVKAELANVTTENFKANSAQVKMKNGKKAIKITWKNTSGAKFDGIEIFRSTKKNSGHGKKPIFTSKSGKFYNTSIKKGKRYYYKVRGYMELDGVKYYSTWSTKAYRIVK